MPVLRLILNILWFVLGGLPMALAWAVAGLIMAITIIGLPWARSCLVIAGFCLWPFGREVVDRRQVTGKAGIAHGPLGMIGNILWFVLAGVWLGIGHLIAAVANFLTIIGIPFGLQHLKIAGLVLAPIGLTVVASDQADSYRMHGQK